MTCSAVDLKAYALGEPAGGAAVAAHIANCETCREELERLRLTQTALLMLADEEVPQRIAFVSDKIFETRWWQRIWQSAPAMGFASAALLAVAIFAHGLFAHAWLRPVTVAQSSGITAAQVDRRVADEVERRVASEVDKVLADSQTREAKAAGMLEAAEKRFELQRQSDIAMMQQAARYYENKIGQLMVASNRNYEGAQ